MLRWLFSLRKTDASSAQHTDESTNIKYMTYLGIGAFGEVWSCEYVSQRYACKILNRKRMKSEDVNLFENEINIWKGLSHSNIVHLHHVFFQHSKIYCLSDLMDESMYDMHIRMLRIGAKPRIITIIKQMIQVSEAMVYLHSKEILHRDIKSANILRRDESFFIADFGLARFYGNEMTAETGSYRWMAPEIVRHESYDKSCDVYSFAMLQYEMMTLCVPFSCYGPIEVAFSVARGKRPPLPPMPEEMKTLIESCWHACKYSRPTFESILDTLTVMRDKKTSFGCLEMSTKPMKRVPSQDCVF